MPSILPAFFLLLSKSEIVKILGPPLVLFMSAEVVLGLTTVLELVGNSFLG